MAVLVVLVSGVFSALVIFVWVFLTPLIIVGAMLWIPACLVAIPVTLVISCTVQWWCRDRVIPDSWLRRAVNAVPWYRWFSDTKPPAVELDRALVTSHPHGVLCCGVLTLLHFRRTDTVVAVTPLLFWIPILGWVVRLLGCIPARYADMRRALETCSVIVVPGGVPEIVGMEFGLDFLERRFGFVKLALETGRPLVATYTRGEHATFWMVPLPCPHRRMRYSDKIGVPLVVPLIIGWYGTWLPKRVRLSLRVGEPMTLRGKKTRHTVQTWKDRYLKRLEQLR